MRTIPVILLALATTVATVADAAPGDDKANMGKGRIATEMSNKGPSGLLGRNCKMLNGVPVWGGLRANNPKAPSELVGTGIKAVCEGGKVSSVTITQGYPGKLPKNTSWNMKWKDVKKTLKKGGMKDRMIADKKAAGGPMVKLQAKGRGASVTWLWADSKGKTPCDRIVFEK